MSLASKTGLGLTGSEDSMGFRAKVGPIINHYNHSNNHNNNNNNKGSGFRV